MTSAARARAAREPAATAWAATTVSCIATGLSLAVLAALLILRRLATGIALALPRSLLLVLATVSAVLIASTIASRLAVSLAIAAT